MPRPNILNPDREIFTSCCFVGPCALAQMSWSENFSRKDDQGGRVVSTRPGRFMHAGFLRGPKHQGLVWAHAHSGARYQHREASCIYALLGAVRIAVCKSVRCLVPTMAMEDDLSCQACPKGTTDSYHVPQSWIFLSSHWLCGSGGHFHLIF